MIAEFLFFTCQLEGSNSGGFIKFTHNYKSAVFSGDC